MKGYFNGLVTGLFVGATVMVYCIYKDEFCSQKECPIERHEEVDDRTAFAAFYSGSPGA